jgi:hypothetical protein
MTIDNQEFLDGVKQVLGRIDEYCKEQGDHCPGGEDLGDDACDECTLYRAKRDVLDVIDLITKNSNKGNEVIC